jgi:hypothetical protein
LNYGDANSNKKEHTNKHFITTPVYIPLKSFPGKGPQELEIIIELPGGPLQAECFLQIIKASQYFVLLAWRKDPKKLIFTPRDQKKSTKKQKK